jgi:hypothetical protein
MVATTPIADPWYMSSRLKQIQASRIGEIGCELGGWWRSPSDTTTVSIRHSQRSFITPTRTGADSTARNLDHRSLWARGLANSAWPMGSSAESAVGGDCAPARGGNGERRIAEAWERIASGCAPQKLRSSASPCKIKKLGLPRNIFLVGEGC